MNKPTITFLGAGNMASSLIVGLVSDHYPCDKIIATNSSSPEKLNNLKECFNVRVTASNVEGAEQGEIWVLAVKPTAVKQVIEEIKPLLEVKKPLIISVVTGIRSSTISKWAGVSALSIVRSMPNTPALLGCGITGLWKNHFVSDEEARIAESILRAVGITLWVENEQNLDAITAISGSGPAYFFLIMETIIDWACKMGFSKEQAELLTIHTALGASRMALESDKDLKILREQVTSPGGTTERAISVLESGQIRNLLDKALQAARERAIEMSQILE